MMHLLHKYDVAPVSRNDAMFAKCAVRHASLGVAVIIGASRHHLPQANIIQQKKSLCLDRDSFLLARSGGFEPTTYRFVAGHSIH